MSASPHSMPNLGQGRDVLGELLHSLSQPLTSLRCSLELSILELSIDEAAERQQEGVAAALRQTETVIGMVQLMREYLDAEHSGPETCAVALAPVLRSVIQELASIAEARGVRVRMAGTCAAVLWLAEARLRLALQYLIAPMIGAQLPGGKVTLLLGDGPEGAVLRAEGDRSSGSPNLFGGNVCGVSNSELEVGSTELQTEGEQSRGGQSQVGQSLGDPVPMAVTRDSTLRRVRLAIARRVLESAGATLALSEEGAEIDSVGFVLRIPRSPLWR